MAAAGQRTDRDGPVARAISRGGAQNSCAVGIVKRDCAVGLRRTVEGGRGVAGHVVAAADTRVRAAVQIDRTRRRRGCGVNRDRQRS